MALVHWPLSLAPRHLSANLNPRNTRGATSMAGITQSISSASAGWQIEYSDIPLFGDRVITWRGLQANIQGILNPIIVPVWEVDRMPKKYGTQRPPANPFLTADDQSYYQPEIGATLTADVARGAVVASIETGIFELVAGHAFSIGTRYYTVRSVTGVAGTVSSITFWPPAREAAASGVAVNFERPVCRVRLASDSEMDIRLEYGRWAFATVNFVEDLS